MTESDKGSVFRLAHLNLRSIFTGFQEFIGIVQVGDFDVMAVTETWLHEHVASDPFLIPGYTFLRCDRPQGRGGGVGFYIKSMYHIERLFMPQVIDGFENLWVKIKINCRTSFTIGVIYRTKNNVLNCARALDDFLPETLSSSDYIAVLGDLNIDFLNVSTTNPILELMDTFGFSQVVHEPTRISRNRLPCWILFLLASQILFFRLALLMLTASVITG